MTINVGQNKRILSLDVFRGLTIVLMIIVNSPGNADPYPILEHAAWNGCTLADIVFPLFLFIVGLTSVISLNRQMQVDDKSGVYQSILVRSLILFILGILLNIFPISFDMSHLRVYGILQRIAVCYLICGVIYLNTRPKTQGLIFFALLFGYWFVMTMIPVPGFGVNQLTPEGSWVAYIDQLIFSSNHLYAKTYDPEGLFSTVPAVATTLSGMLTGSLLLTPLQRTTKLYTMLLIGCIFISLGWVWNDAFPINKNLWTSSYVLWTCGIGMLVFALCYLVIDILGYQKWALPLKIFGMNALFAFVFHVLLLKLQFIFILPLKNGGSGNFKAVITDYLFGQFATHNAALFYSISFLLLNFLVVSILYWRKVFIRI